jgi:hypothetical protein
VFTVLAAIGEFERELIRERTLLGVRAAQAAGKAVGRPRRVFRRDVARMRESEAGALVGDVRAARASIVFVLEPLRIIWWIIALVLTQVLLQFLSHEFESLTGLFGMPICPLKLGSEGSFEGGSRDTVGFDGRAVSLHDLLPFWARR